MRDDVGETVVISGASLWGPRRIAAIVAESYKPGVTAESVAHRYGVTLDDLRVWRSTANNPRPRAMGSTQKPRAPRTGLPAPRLHKPRLKGVDLERAIDVVIESRKPGIKQADLAARVGITPQKLWYWRALLGQAADDVMRQRQEAAVASIPAAVQQSEEVVEQVVMQTKRKDRVYATLADVAALAVTGLNPPQIAAKLGISKSQAYRLFCEWKVSRAPVVEASPGVEAPVSLTRPALALAPVSESFPKMGDWLAPTPSAEIERLHRIIGQQTVEIMRLREELAGVR
jgi:transposase-like protein